MKLLNKKKFSLTEIFFIISLIMCFLFISFNTISSGFNILTKDNFDTGITSFFSSVLLFLFIIFHLKNFDRKSNSINIILALFTIYFILIYFTNSEIRFVELIKLLIQLLWVFCFYLGDDISEWNEKKIGSFVSYFTIIVIIPLSVQIFNYYLTRDILSIKIGNDAIFGFIVYLPLIFMIKNKDVFKTVLLFIFLIICFLSYKRTIIISTIFSIFIYYSFILDKEKLYKHLFKWYSIIFYVFLSMIIIFLNKLIGLQVIERFANLSEDGGSGRDFIYSKLLNTIINSDFTSILFGHGYRSTESIVGMLAHNDLIQMLFDFGLIGAILYISIILSLIKLAFRKFRDRKHYIIEYSSYVASITMLILLTQTNCFIYSYTLLSPMMFIIGIQYNRLIKQRK